MCNLNQLSSALLWPVWSLVSYFLLSRWNNLTKKRGFAERLPQQQPAWFNNTGFGCKTLSRSVGNRNEQTPVVSMNFSVKANRMSRGAHGKEFVTWLGGEWGGVQVRRPSPATAPQQLSVVELLLPAISKVTKKRLQMHIDEWMLPVLAAMIKILRFPRLPPDKSLPQKAVFTIHSDFNEIKLLKLYMRVCMLHPLLWIPWPFEGNFDTSQERRTLTLTINKGGGFFNVVFGVLFWNANKLKTFIICERSKLAAVSQRKLLQNN